MGAAVCVGEGVAICVDTDDNLPSLKFSVALPRTRVSECFARLRDKLPVITVLGVR